MNKKYVAKTEIKRVFKNVEQAKYKGLWFSEYEHEGYHKMWWPNGNLKAYSEFKNGEMEGNYKKWDYSGLLIKHLIYKDGRLSKKIIE